jgi:hypothetical protein
VAKSQSKPESKPRSMPARPAASFHLIPLAALKSSAADGFAFAVSYEVAVLNLDPGQNVGCKFALVGTCTPPNANVRIRVTNPDGTPLPNPFPPQTSSGTNGYWGADVAMPPQTTGPVRIEVCVLTDVSSGVGAAGAAVACTSMLVNVNGPCPGPD